MKNNSSIYLDYAATTPVDPHVIETMNYYMCIDGIFGNAASTHEFGRRATEAIELAREEVASLINASSNEIFWTSGATESINLALKGVACKSAYFGRGRHIVTSSLEHKATLDSCKYLIQNGFEITFVQPSNDGLITPHIIEEAIREDTILVSLMYVNNEVGTVTDISEIGQLTRSNEILFHVDASQGIARLPFDVKLNQVDLASFSGHKMYGPKGVGVLYIRDYPLLPIEPQIHGGDQEKGIRPGTLATHQIVGMGTAASLITSQRNCDMAKIIELDRDLIESLLSIEQISMNGNQLNRVPGIANLNFTGVKSDALFLSLPEIAISSGSACTSSNIESSHVLRSLGLSDEEADCSVRTSIGRFSTKNEIDLAVSRIQSSIFDLRQLSSEWK